MPFILIATELDLPGKMMALKMTLKRNLYGIFMNQHSIAIIEVGRLSLSLRVFPWYIVSKSKRESSTNIRKWSTYSIGLLFISLLPVP